MNEDSMRPDQWLVSSVPFSVFSIWVSALNFFQLFEIFGWMDGKKDNPKV